MNEIERQIHEMDRSAHGAVREVSIVLKQIDVIRDHYANRDGDREANAVKAEIQVSLYAKAMSDEALAKEIRKDYATAMEMARRDIEQRRRSDWERDAADLPTNTDKKTYLAAMNEAAAEPQRMPLTSEEQRRYNELAHKRDRQPLELEEAIERGRILVRDPDAEVRYQQAQIARYGLWKDESDRFTVLKDKRNPNDGERDELASLRRREALENDALRQLARSTGTEGRLLKGGSQGKEPADPIEHANRMRELRRLEDDYRRSDRPPTNLSQASTAALIGAVEANTHDKKLRQALQLELQKRYEERAGGSRSPSEFTQIGNDAERLRQGRALMQQLGRDHEVYRDGR